jgi:hypothetical protein
MFRTTVHRPKQCTSRALRSARDDGARAPAKLLDHPTNVGDMPVCMLLVTQAVTAVVEPPADHPIRSA